MQKTVKTNASFTSQFWFHNHPGARKEFEKASASTLALPVESEHRVGLLEDLVCVELMG